MNYMKEIHPFKSSNQINTITYYIYRPLTTPRGILQISHGMCEYIERYEDFIEFLTGNGILVCGNDHIGHKNSVTSKKDLGYFAPKNGCTFLVNDLACLSQIMKKQYPNLPILLFGHSMGSLIARAYITEYANYIQGAIICGTAGTNRLLLPGQLLISLVKTLRGDHYRSKLINQIMFGGYNHKYPSARTSFDWLTTDESIVDRYQNDIYCNFIFTTSAFYDLTMLLKQVNNDSWYRKIPKNLPIFLISGDMDPVGNYGKGIREVKDKLSELNLKDFSYTLYPGLRHEIINEREKEKVYDDILAWINWHL